MFLRLIFSLLISGWCSVNCLVHVPTSYRKAELALNRYFTHSSYNPMIHSLLNVLIHVKQARAFIYDDAIEMALEHVKEFDQETKDHSEQLFRQIIYGVKCNSNDKDCLTTNESQRSSPPPNVKQRIIVALDKFFDNLKEGDQHPHNTLDENENLNRK